MSEQDQNIAVRFRDQKICILIPTFNNSKTLQKVLEGVFQFTRQVIVVNDGSTDDTSAILTAYPDIHTITFPENKGKGMALRTGFLEAVQRGYDYAITIDSDGQHFPDDLPAFLDQLEQEGPALIIGSRNMNQSSVPGKSSFGHKFSNFWFLVETGIKAPDTQSGYRLYPVALMKDMQFFTRKFEFEIEVLVRAAWSGIRISSVPVSVYYAPSSERVSHFRPIRDFTRISILNTVLVLITLVYINPRNFFRSIFSKATYGNLWQEIFHRDEPVALTAISAAFGVFMGIIPIWGFQLLVAITLAIAFRLNKTLVILCANISIPPMIPLIIFLSYKMGAVWTGAHSISLSLEKGLDLDAIHVNFVQYLYGSITLAFLAALITGLVTWSLVTFFRRKKISLTHE
jgi:glycosyltransferase involved in cell wall biosynthesis